MSMKKDDGQEMNDPIGIMNVFADLYNFTDDVIVIYPVFLWWEGDVYQP